jgi:hypothetical protein
MKENIDNIILMADVVDSRKADQKMLLKNFKAVIEYANRKNKADLLSPMTITLGDEFQSVIKNLAVGLNIIIDIEERLISTRMDFKLRYVLLEGQIETPVNPKIGYGMMGSGLTASREYLEQLKKTKHRVCINIKDNKRSDALGNAFIIFQELVDSWRMEKDYYIVTEFLKGLDYKKAAEKLDKERSLIWKREKSLRLQDYFAIKKIINYLGENDYR